MLQPLPSRIQKDGTVSTICPSCGAVRPFPSDSFRIKSRSFKVTCPCGTTFTAVAEFRKAYRRQVNLCGTYVKLSSGNETGEIRIQNLSMTGVGFVAEDGHRLLAGDEVMLRIVFDKGESTQMEVVGEVVHLSDTYAGCRFKEMSSQQEETLASYLVLIP